MTSIYDILKKAEAEFPKPDPSKDVLTYFLRQGWHEAIAFIRSEVDTAVISDSDLISPIQEEREMREAIRKVFEEISEQQGDMKSDFDKYQRLVNSVISNLGQFRDNQNEK